MISFFARSSSKPGKDFPSVRAHHVTVLCALGIDRADILAVIELERQADAVARLNVAFAVSDLIEDKATGDGAERVGLLLADFEEFGRTRGDAKVWDADLSPGSNRRLPMQHILQTSINTQLRVEFWLICCPAAQMGRRHRGRRLLVDDPCPRRRRGALACRTAPYGRTP
jgi:hypothetical protein